MSGRSCYLEADATTSGGKKVFGRDCLDKTTAN